MSNRGTGLSVNAPKAAAFRIGTQPGDDLGGVRNLLRLRDRCYVDPETECWHWKLAICQGSPTVAMVHPVTGKRVKMRGRRAALILKTGADLAKGHSAYALLKCKSLDCVNPDHCQSGSRLRLGKSHAASGRLKGNHRRSIVGRENVEASRKLTSEQVRAIRAGGKSDKAFGAAFGVSASAVWAAKKGLSHKHVPLIATSVFDWRPA